MHGKDFHRIIRIAGATAERLFHQAAGPHHVSPASVNAGIESKRPHPARKAGCKGDKLNF
jgi:hypothetical protein